ncbi:MAG: hypothetical protein K9M80_02185 [Candidatus Marinimicrobia bacterium]|nr:hypothetical protein [Candidatus Neomarinimicrobiota bacterium]
MSNKLFKYLKDFIKSFDQHLKSEATEELQYELEEMEFVFALLIYSSLIGIPGIPEAVAIELLPYMGEELERFEEKSIDSDDQLAQLFSKFNFE